MSVSNQQNQIAVIAVILALGLGGCAAPSAPLRMYPATTPLAQPETSGAAVGPAGPSGGTGVLATPGAVLGSAAAPVPTVTTGVGIAPGSSRAETPASATTAGADVTPAVAPTTKAPASPTVWPTPNAPLRTSEGTLTRIEPLKNGVRLHLTPDLSSMRADFDVVDWSRVTALDYWAGLQTPTPVADDQRAAVVTHALNHRVTIGYYDTNPPTIVLVSIHKQEGDPQ